MPLVSGGVPTRQRGAPKRPAVLGWVAAVFGRFLQFAVEPNILRLFVLDVGEALSSDLKRFDLIAHSAGRRL